MVSPIWPRGWSERSRLPSRPRRRPPSSLPETDVTIRLKDYDFESSQPLAAGKQRIMVENAGPQVHEVVTGQAGTWQDS